MSFIRLFLLLAFLVPFADDGVGIDPHGGVRAQTDEGSGWDPNGRQ